MAYLVNDDLAIEIDDGDSEATLQLNTIDYKSYDAALQSIDLGDGATQNGDQIDLTNNESSVTIGGVIFENALNEGSGTGNYSTFLAIGGNSGTVSGFNTDATAQDGHNPDNDGIADVDYAKSEVVRVGQLTTVTVNGQEYYEIRYDLNEPDNGSDNEITIENLQIFVSSNGDIIDYDSFSDEEKIYDMDEAAGDPGTYLLLDENSTGSGTDDYRILIPVDMIDDPDDYYFYLYVEMGRTDPVFEEEGGFEEFRANLQPFVEDPVLEISKEAVRIEDASGVDVVLDGEGMRPDDFHADEAGDIIHYEIEVTNGGNVSLTNIMVSDESATTFAEREALFEGVNYNVGDLDHDNELDTNETWIYDATYLVTQTDLDNNGEDGDDPDELGDGVLYNTATADSAETESVEADEDVPVDQTPGINIDKEAVRIEDASGVDVVLDGEGMRPDDFHADEAGDIIHYEIEVTNGGNVSLTNIMVSDESATTFAEREALFEGVNYNVGDLDHDNELDTNETWIYDATYLVTQTDLDNNGEDGDDPDELGDGVLYNTATADSAETESVEADEDVPVDPEDPVLEISKEAVRIEDASGVDVVLDGEGMRPDDFHADEAGDIIHYEIEVTNGGNVSLTNIMVSDESATTFAEREALFEGVNYNVGDLDHDNELDTNETWIYDATYLVTQTDLDNNGEDGDDPDELGDGVLYNTATADSAETESVEADEDVPVDQTPGINIDKEAVRIEDASGVDVVLDGEGMRPDDFHADEAGDIIHYEIEVTNGGNVSLTNIMVSDESATTFAEREALFEGVNYNVGDLDHDNELDTNETWIYDATYLVTQTDLDNNGEDGDDPDELGDGVLYNTATADSAETESVEADEDVPVDQTPGINIDKEAVRIEDASGVDVVLDGEGMRPDDFHADEAGDIIHYEIEVTNGGNVSLTNIMVSDESATTFAEREALFEGVNYNVGDLDHDNELDTNETWIYDATYLVTQTDLDNNGEDGDDPDELGDGVLYNTATADSAETESVEADEDVPVDFNPDVSITKEILSITGGIDSNPDVIDSAGDIINYRIVIANEGNVTLDAEFHDDLIESDPGLLVVESGGDAALNGNGILDVGEIWTITGSYVVSDMDFNTNGDVEVLTDVPGLISDTDQLGYIDNMAVVTTQFADVNDNASADAPIIQDGGWFGTPGFWSHWTEFYDGISENEPKQSNTDFFPAGELATDSKFVSCTIDGEDMFVELNGIMIDDMFFSVDFLVDALNGSESKGPKNAVEILARDLAALVLNMAANPGTEMWADTETALEPIDLVRMSYEWLNENGNGTEYCADEVDLDANVRTRSGNWKNPVEYTIVEPVDPNDGEVYDLSAQQLHESIDHLNNWGHFHDVGGYEGGNFGIDRDLEMVEHPDEFIEAYYTVLAVEEADAMLELKSSTALLGDYTADKEADGSLTIMPKTDTSDTDMMSFYEMDSMPLFDYFGGGFEMDTKSAFSAASYFEMPDINIGKFGFTSALIQDSVAAFVPSSPFADQPMKYDAGLDVGVYDIDADDLFVF